MTARIDLTTCRCVSYRQADRSSCEFPAVHPQMHVVAASEKAPRYSYLMANDAGLRLPYSHVVKADKLHKGRQSYHFEGQTVGEPCFVPRPGAIAEDDGYVIVQVFDPATKSTSFAVLDAQNLPDGPVCSLDLQTFLPNGF